MTNEWYMTSCYPVNTLCLQLHVNLSFHVRVNNQAGEGKIWGFLLLKHFNLDSAAQRVAQLIPYSLPHLLCRQLCNHLPLRPAFHTVDGLSVLCSGLTAAFHVQVSLYQAKYGRSQYRDIELFFSMIL